MGRFLDDTPPMLVFTIVFLVSWLAMFIPAALYLNFRYDRESACFQQVDFEACLQIEEHKFP